MSFSVFVESRAEKDLKKLPREVRDRIFPKILDLKHNPRPAGVKKLSVREEYYRLRVGDWRVVYSGQDARYIATRYEIDDKQKKISVFRIRHRREAYQNL